MPAEDQRPAGRWPPRPREGRRRRWTWFLAGVAAGSAIYGVTAVAVFSREPAAAMPGDLRPFEYTVFALAATALLLVAGGLLALAGRTRALGQGVLLSVAVGLTGTGAGCAALVYI